MSVSSGASNAAASTPFNPVRSYLLAKTAPTYSRVTLHWPCLSVYIS